MNYASVYSNLKKAINPLLKVTSEVAIQQTRNTFILKRKFETPIIKKGAKVIWKQQLYVYEMIENQNLKRRQNIDVILSSFVEGLGVRGDKISVHPYFAYKKLLLPGLAVYATPENIKKFEEEIGAPQQAYSSPYVPQTMRMLDEFLLEVVMSADNPWTLAPEHVWSAFRESKIHMSRESIELPERAINGPDLEMENKEFYATVTINKREKVNVRCRLRYRSNNPNKFIPDPEAHLKESEPIYPEFKEVLDKISVHSALKKKLEKESNPKTSYIFKKRH